MVDYIYIATLTLQSEVDKIVYYGSQNDAIGIGTCLCLI